MNPLKQDLDHILAHTSAVWNSLRSENIFVTGGTGFFGRWLLESFAHANRELNLNARMVVLSRNPDAFKTKAPHLAIDRAIRFVAGDVRNLTAAAVREQLGDSALEQSRFVIHAATDPVTPLTSENPLLMVDTIVQGTRAVLDFALASNAKRVLFISSGAVYGKQPSDLLHINEDYLGAPDPTDPNSAYGEAKRFAELLCACFRKQHRIEVTIARGFAFVGPFLPLDAHFAIGNFIGDAIAGRPIRVRGDGTPFRSYLYAADLAIWLWTILFRGKSARAYNVGSERALSIAEVATEVSRVLRPDAKVQIERPKSTMAPARYVPSARRAQLELGLIESISIDAAIARTGEFAKRYVCSRRTEETFQ